MAEMVILVGIQGAGKTTFYRERFFDTHVRISLDLVKTRERERHLIAACLAVGQPFVIDNTNTLASDRAPYLAAAKQAGFRSIGYKRMEPPTAAEGFDVLYTVTLDEENRFTVEP